ncbi:MAG: dTMP kinase [Verrucomicrobiota bacterium]
MPGLFISFEGGEGCGKSTQIGRLAERLRGLGETVHQTREPGGTKLGEAIRNLLQHEYAGEGMSPESELLLFTASRAQITRELIGPALAAGDVVLCDRFMDSTTVYQGIARAIDAEQVAAINNFAVGDAKPDLTILLDLTPEIGMQRVLERSGGKLDRMEKEDLTFFNEVRRGYLELADEEPDRFLVLDAGRSVETIEAEIWNAVEPRLT